MILIFSVWDVNSRKFLRNLLKMVVFQGMKGPFLKIFGKKSGKKWSQYPWVLHQFWAIRVPT